MITLFSLLIGLLFTPIASAMGLGDIGMGDKFSGSFKGMWDDVCTILPYCKKGDMGVGIVTGIIIKTVLWIIGSGAVLMILYAAVRIVASGGNDEMITKGKKVIFYAALGLLFAVAASVIVNFVFSFVTGVASAV